MRVQMKDRFEDCINVGHRRAGVMFFCISGLLLMPFWFTISSYFLVRQNLIRESQIIFWTPVLAGTAGCLLLPIEPLSIRLLVAIAYTPVAAVFLVGFSITVGCLLIGSCL